MKEKGKEFWGSIDCIRWTWGGKGPPMGSSPGGYLLPGGVGHGGISHQNKFRTTFVSCTEITRKLISRVFFSLYVLHMHSCFT